MRLSSKGRYAVMALADLVVHSGGQPVALADIAQRQAISLSYLEQLFARLRRGGIVRSVRGPGGGYLLATAASQTRISAIVAAVDEPMGAGQCVPGAPEACLSGDGRCLTHGLWEGLGEQIRDYLSSVSLADVCEGGLPADRRERPPVAAA
jgi:Rrf2 family iron-sulfur cluster assembly transcriptional regulator